MTRQSISLTTPNDAWLKSQIDSEEYNSKSELVNDLIRRAREREEGIARIREKLIAADTGTYTTLTPQEILDKSKAEFQRNGKL